MEAHWDEESSGLKTSVIQVRRLNHKSTRKLRILRKINIEVKVNELGLLLINLLLDYLLHQSLIQQKTARKGYESKIINNKYFN